MRGSKTVHRVMGWDPVRMVWTVRSSHDDENEAAEHAEALWWKKKKRLRVMVLKGTVRVIVFHNPPICNVSREFRENQAMQMSDLADAKRVYKSPG